MQAGDVIQAVGGTKVSTSDDVASAIGQYKPGDKVAVTVHRGSGQETLSVTLGTQPSQAPTNG